jgi:hypothetical protein
MALVLVRDFRRVPSVAAGIAFFVTIAAHLVLTSPDYERSTRFCIPLHLSSPVRSGCSAERCSTKRAD